MALKRKRCLSFLSLHHKAVHMARTWLVSLSEGQVLMKFTQDYVRILVRVRQGERLCDRALWISLLLS